MKVMLAFVGLFLGAIAGGKTGIHPRIKSEDRHFRDLL
jgi:hypothetical protein